MPVTAIDERTALIVVDLQKGILGMLPAEQSAGVIERACALIEAFRQQGLPVVLVNVAGGAPGRTEEPRRVINFPEGFTDLLPELNQQSSDLVVTKHTWGAFTHTGLEERLKSMSVTQVVVAGVATGTGVEATARQAYEAGFNVTLATDAMTDRRPGAHEYSIGSVFPRIGETGTSQEILDLLEKRSVA